MSNVMHLAPLDLYTRLLDDGARPRLAWSSEDGERLELSGRVLANWIAKIANLLDAEADASPGSTVVIDLPPHWRTVAWTLGTWATGTAVVVLEDQKAGPPALPEEPDAVATTRPLAWLEPVRSDVVVAVALPSFALRWPGELPGAAFDGSTDVASYPDALGPVGPIGPEAAAVVVGDRSWTFADLAQGLLDPADLPGGWALVIGAIGELAGEGIVPLRG